MFYYAEFCWRCGCFRFVTTHCMLLVLQYFEDIVSFVSDCFIALLCFYVWIISVSIGFFYFRFFCFWLCCVNFYIRFCAVFGIIIKHRWWWWIKLCIEWSNCWIGAYHMILSVYNNWIGMTADFTVDFFFYFAWHFWALSADQHETLWHELKLVQF